MRKLSPRKDRRVGCLVHWWKPWGPGETYVSFLGNLLGSRVKQNCNVTLGSLRVNGGYKVFTSIMLHLEKTFQNDELLVWLL